MLERYLCDVLTSYFGQYIQDIDIEQIRVSAWRGGAIVLRNVQLRPDCIQQYYQSQQQQEPQPSPKSQEKNTTRKNDDTDSDDDDEEEDEETDELLLPSCPIEMIYGHIGRLELRIPWKVVRKQLLQWPSTSSTSSSSTTQNKNNHNTTKSNMVDKKDDTDISILLGDVNIVIAPVVVRPPTQQHPHKQRRRRRSAAATNKDPKSSSSLNPNDDDDNNNTQNNVEAMIHHEQSIQAALDAELLQRVTASSTTTTTTNATTDKSTDSSSNHANTNTDTPPSSWKQRFLERFKAIFANLSVTVQNIHVRYEDPGGGFRTATTTIATSITTTPSDKDNNNTVWSPIRSTPSTKPQFYYNNNIGVLSSPYRYVTNVPSIPEEESHDHHTLPFVPFPYPARSHPRLRPSFAIGMTLREFTIQQSSLLTHTTTTVTTTPPLSLPKVVMAAAHDVAVYWDSDVPLMTTTCQEMMDESTTTTTTTSRNTFWADAFEQLNAVTGGGIVEHSYVLHPFSPWIQFGLLPSSLRTTVMDTAKNTSGYNTMDITFPPCRWNISKHLLDDIKYLRKSLSQWQNQQRLLQPIRDMKHRLYLIQHLRPPTKQFGTKSNVARQWWHYAYAAVRILTQPDEDHRAFPTVTTTTTTTTTTTSTSMIKQTGTSHPYQALLQPSQKRGWIGLAQALGRRKKYTTLFRHFLQHYQDSNRGKMEQYHQELLRLERTLSVNEVKSFRIACEEHIRRQVDDQYDSILWRGIQSLLTDPYSDDSNHGDISIESMNDATTSLLSAEHRIQMFVEMAAALQRERCNIEFRNAQRDAMTNETNENVMTWRDQEKRLMWKISVQCVEFSVQVNDTIEYFGKKQQHNNKDIPVVRLSCAFSQDQELFHCGSWNMSTRVGSLFVKDCTVASTNGGDMGAPSIVFPNLVAMKSNKNTEEIQPNDTFTIDGVVHNQNIWVEIKRYKWKEKGEIVMSRTETNVRVLPLEIVYSTVPVESLSHIFGTSNEDFSVDYNRIVNRLSMWKNRQQKRLLHALAHKQKQISFDVMIGAPILLVPFGRGETDSLLIFDFGKLHCCSDASNEGRSEYDDQWLLELTNVQIKSSPVVTYFSPSPTKETPRYIVEPFSLRFDIFTRVENDASELIEKSSSVLALASLPRLALNVNSSDVFHLGHLQAQWAKRKKERRPNVPDRDRSTRQTSDRNQNEGEDFALENVARRFEFRFVAPVFTVRFETKSRRFHARSDNNDTPLFDFALKGIEGNFARTLSTRSIDTTFCAKVRGLIAVDLFQPAGIDYSILLSSINPEYLQGICNISSFSDKYLSGDHLVTFDYMSKLDQQCDTSFDQGSIQRSEESNRLKINFHELFVEWNPETIAMISAAIGAPSIDENETNDIQKEHMQVTENDDEFFDAEEDAFYDAESVASVGDDSRLLSEISDSARSSTSDFNVISNVGSLSPWPGAQLPIPTLARPVPPEPSCSLRNSMPNATDTRTRSEQFVVVFELSKLRVNFNKESRHRRLITAEMDGTKIRYSKVISGGSKVFVSIGNLTFSDCESLHNNTLYREVLGLKTDESTTSGEKSSLLEMKMITKPRSRKFVYLDEASNDLDSSVDLPVFVDMSKGRIHGFDNYFQATLSPMRFVYLQQLWFEIVDYFFTAIVGYEIWGSKTPIPGDTTMLDGRSIGADAIPFTSFDIVLKSPTILIPVSPCSTDFFRINASLISLRNRYEFDALRPPTLQFRLDGENRQWFNNCDITIVAIEICSWSGSVLNPGESRPTSTLSISWPVGPSAPVNVPKWKVVCALDETNVILDRYDYALLQHVIQHNLGGDSLHMDEWNMFQQLDSAARNEFNENLLVHFPYDKKDSTPSTFDMILSIPKISSVFTLGKGRDIAIVHCTNLQWNYLKLLDRVSRQKITCNVEVIDSILGRALLSSDEYGKLDNDGTLPKMEYTSCSFPSVKHEKSLLITSACIDIILQSWMNLSAFFQAIPLPSYLPPNEAIQVGDRWYKIGDQPARDTTKEKLERLRWIEKLGPLPSHELEASSTMKSIDSTFRCSLVNLAVQVRSAVSALTLSVEKFQYLQICSIGTTTQTFELIGVEFQTRQAKVRRTSDFSLIRPWNVKAVLVVSDCQGTKSCACMSHLCSVNADVLHGRTAFSDILVALDACMNLLRDVKSSNLLLSNGTRSSQSMESENGKLSSAHTVTLPCNRQVSILWGGISFILVDDSGRHFLRDQNLAHVGTQLIDFKWRNSDDVKLCHCATPSTEQIKLNMKLQVLGFNIIDCLQSNTSPFREVISVSPTSSSTNRSVSLTDHDIRAGFEVWSETTDSTTYGIEFSDVVIQYNPSFVIALQRFLGRLNKEVKKKHGDFFQELMPVASNKSVDANISGPTTPIASYQLSASIPSISILLNKEHQNRQLLKAEIKGVLLDFNMRAAFSIVKGQVNSFSVTDPKGCGLSEIVMQSTTRESRFVEFIYIVFFNQRTEDAVYNDLPIWVHSKLNDEEMIDDMINVSVGTHDMVYIAPRTAELLDYLSNGMPGKGMGATSRAAKGFVDQRLLRRTYANIEIGIPRVLIPNGEDNGLFIELRLGMLNFRSWTIARENASPSRLIQLHLRGFSMSLIKEANDMLNNRSLMDNLNFQVDVEICDTLTTIHCGLSAVAIRLSYLDYLSLKSIASRNLSNIGNKQQWDNLERAWAKESNEDESNLNSMEVEYSSSARVIRYGQSSNAEKKMIPIKATIKLESIGLVLRRDDRIHSYDLICFRGEILECDFGMKNDGEHWLHLSLGKIFVVDLGRMGRLLRSSYTSSTYSDLQKAETFGILIAGYNSTGLHACGESGVVDSQLVFKAEKEACSGNVNAVAIISFISVTVFVEPIQDLINFVACKWNESSETENTRNFMILSEGNPDAENSVKLKGNWMSSLRSKISFRFVSHYARFIFAADESDYQSRCLIVQGLSIANLSYLPKVDKLSNDMYSFTLNMDFQNVSSHIYPDISDIVCLRSQHAPLLVGIVPANDIEILKQKLVETSSDEYSTPLLLPLTLSIEYELEAKPQEPMLRSLAVSVDPISILFSNEDLRLIQAIVNGWTMNGRKSQPPNVDGRNFYDVTFTSQRLGLGLRKEASRIIVDNVAELNNHDSIQTGDSILALNGIVISDIATISLNEMVSRLSSTPRPLTVTFLRNQNVTALEDEANLHETSTKVGTDDKINVSIASAVVTVIEREVPLLKAAISMTKIACNMIHSKGTAIRLEASTTTNIDYYNLKIWGWEPFLDPGVFYLSMSFQDARHGPRDLSVEIGDKEMGFSINLTDAFVDTVSKLLDWRQKVSSEPNDSISHEFKENVASDDPRKFSARDFSIDAANAAFHFAARQKSGITKPFEFRNRTGLSIAFARYQADQTTVKKTEPLNCVGEYNGMQQYESSDITVLSNAEDLKFRIDVSSFADKWNCSHTGRFPSFIVALQTTAGVSVKPFENLDTSQIGEVLLPIRFGNNTPINLQLAPPVRRWATWSVEQLNERTIVTLGSSIRVVSMLSNAIEIGISSSPDQDGVGSGATIIHLGILREGVQFNLPLWIAMQQQIWYFYVRVGTEYVFTPIFTITSSGMVTLQETISGCIECIPAVSTKDSAWLSVSLTDEGGVSLVIIDCTVSIRNLLPIAIEWEVAKDGSKDFGFTDGSRFRSQSLLSGEEVEVLASSFQAAKIRVCPTLGNFTWSSWFTLSFPLKSDTIKHEKQTGEEESSSVQEDFYATLFVKDVFHINLPLGLRISSKPSGIDVTIYSDLWCTNNTSLHLIFGLPMLYEKHVEPMKALSVGEATLKEISSLFESGDFTRKYDVSSRDGLTDIIRIPGQVASHITEECFEYVEVEGTDVVSRWWASDNPFSSREYLMGSDHEHCNWIDKTWKVDSFGTIADGWESSIDLNPFLANRTFNSSHRYRRRRWSRTRQGMEKRSTVSSVDAFAQLPKDKGPLIQDGKTMHSVQLAIQVNGGRWSKISAIPRQGSFHGVVRVSKSRWLFAEGESNGADKTVYELCYVVSPLDGDWGLLTRSFVVTSRFLCRNDSKLVSFEVKQAGASDLSSVIVQPGQTAPFHWGSYHLPELVSVRPITMINGRCIYKWSGGFDPLLIGHLPLRLRKISNISNTSETMGDAKSVAVHSVKVEIEIRQRTGGTGINLVFQEEDEAGEGALFRIENGSPFPIWFCQDDILANPSRLYGATDYSDVVNPSKSVVFSLDIPFRQGKYSHRKAAALTTLLRARLALAPLTTRAGIETTKVVSIAIGERVRLNPSKLMILNPEIRHVLQDVRIFGAVINDGPTRVLRFSMTSQGSSDIQPWPNLSAMTWHDDLPLVFKATVQGAGIAAEMRKSQMLTSESEINFEIQKTENGMTEYKNENSSSESMSQVTETRNLIVSFRAAFSGLTLSLVDSAPSEIAVATFNNINALATWDTLRASDSTIFITVASLQVDNMVPNSPFPVAVCPFDFPHHGRNDETSTSEADSPLLVVGLSFAPKHKSRILCLKSATIAPRNLAIKVDLAFLVRLQKYFLDMKEHFIHDMASWDGHLQPPDISKIVSELNAASQSGVDSQKVYFGGLTILPCNVKLSVAPARALTPAQAALEGPEIAAIHQAVRKGDVRVDKKSAGILGVKIGSRNKTPLAVVRGLFKSFIVDGFLRLDGASLNFSGVSLRYHTSTTSQLTTALTAHYLASLRQNLPSVIGSLAAFGNPLGLVRGLGEGVGDFVLEPVRGFQRSVQEMDASYLVDGVARGTLSLTRHTVGGFADSAAMIAETFSKNMAVLTLDRKYAQKRDRGEVFRDYDDINVASGLGSGVQKLVNGFMEGVTGVVRAPIRGAEKHGLEGFAKGIGKGLLGLLVKPIIGISDGFSDVMIGVKGSVEGSSTGSYQPTQVRPRRALYGQEKAIRTFNFPDAAASALMLRTRLASEPYLSHLDLGDRVILLSCKRGVLLGRHGEELMLIKLKQIDSVEIRGVTHEDGSIEWGVVIVLDTSSATGNDVEVVVCKEKSHAEQLCKLLEHGKEVAKNS